MSDNFQAPALEELDSDGSGAESDTSQDLEQIVRAVNSQTRHPPVRVPQRGCPFDDEETVQEFLRCLAIIHHEGTIPTGYGLCSNEEHYIGYQELHFLAVGRREANGVEVKLPEVVWWPRYVLWVQALEALTLTLEDNDLNA